MAKSLKPFEVADALHSAAIHLLRRLRVQDLASGVGPAKLSALSVLVFSRRPLGLAELAAAEQVKNPTMSRLIAAMERDGLVSIAASKEDARAMEIRPTKKGERLLLAGKEHRFAAKRDSKSLEARPSAQTSFTYSINVIPKKSVARPERS